MANRKNFSTVIPADCRNVNPISGESIVVMSSARTASRSASDYSRRKPVARWLPPTSYHLFEDVDVRPRGETNQWGPFGVSSQFGTLINSSHYGTYLPTLAYLGVSDTFPSDLAQKALTKARLKLKSSDINLAQAFGERAQTAGLVAEQLTRVAELYRAFRRGHWNELRRIYGGLSVRKMRKAFLREWLAFQYGVKPLLMDIHGAVTALDKTPYDQYIVTVKAGAKSKVSGRYDYHKANSNALVTNHYRIVAEASYGSFVRIDAVPANGALATAASLGFTNPLNLAWELLPFSFVVDWAWPLGDYFSQMDALAGWEIKGCSTSNFTKISSTVTGLNFTGTDGYPRTQNFEGKWRRVQLDRDAGTTVPFPTLPSVKNPVSTTHLMNALALLTEATRVV